MERRRRIFACCSVNRSHYAFANSARCLTQRSTNAVLLNVASTCILIFAGKLSETAKQRLKVIYENSDGFIIAREDLRIRGPGELLGPRQSGLPSLRYANIEEDIDLVEAARDAATKLEADATFNRTAFVERWVKHRAEFAKA